MVHGPSTSAQCLNIANEDGHLQTYLCNAEDPQFSKSTSSPSVQDMALILHRVYRRIVKFVTGGDRQRRRAKGKHTMFMAAGTIM